MIDINKRVYWNVWKVYWALEIKIAQVIIIYHQCRILYYKLMMRLDLIRTSLFQNEKGSHTQD